MANFEVMKTDFSGVADSCIYELEKFITDNPHPLKF